MRRLNVSLATRFVSRHIGVGCLFLLSPSLVFAAKSNDLLVVKPVSSAWEFVYQNTIGSAAGGTIGPREYQKAGDVWGDVLQTEKGWLTRDGAFNRTAPSVPVQVARRVPWSSVARIATKTLGVVGVASVAYDVWTALRCKYENGQIMCDPGTDPVEGQGEGLVFNTTCQPDRYFSTQNDACANAVSQCAGPTGVVLIGTKDGRCHVYDNNTPNGFIWLFIGSKPATVPQTKCPNGATPSDFDGKCPSGSYSPKSEDGAADHFGKNAPKVPGAEDKAPGIVAEGDANGAGAPASEPKVTGPSSQSGQPSSETVTGPNGTTTTTTTPKYNYTYSPNGVTYSTSTTTVHNITNNEGDTITTTTQTDIPPPPQEQLTDCDKNPDAVGCLPLGEVPDEEIPKVNKEVAVTAEAVNLGAKCPAPIEAAGYSLSFDAACDFSSGVKPFILAAAAFFAAMIVIRSIQQA